MKRTKFMFLVCCLFALAANAQVVKTNEGITFVVDKNLGEPQKFYRLIHPQYSKRIPYWLLSSYKALNTDKEFIASSFGNETFAVAGTQPMFRFFRDAYAQHRPIVLTPDAVWLLIAQGFSHYVNTNSEELRSQLVEHDGKIDLIAVTNKSLYDPDYDWENTLEQFRTEIVNHTKGDIAETLTADFTTTGLTERLASDITLMDAFKPYFDYQEMYQSCGIPSVTLKGTPEDWQKVLDKAMKLEKYGLGWWTSELKPVLQEFVKASQGKINRKFWQRIVKVRSVKELKGGGCSGEKPTTLDGWFLSFFPFDSNGKTPNKVPFNTYKMLPEVVKTGFVHNVLDLQGKLISSTNMELWAGFIGIDEDTITNTLSPKIGWAVREADNQEDAIVTQVQRSSSKPLRIDKVPEGLKKLTHLHELNLDFTGKVVLPEWLEELDIKILRVNGQMTDEEKEAIKKRFPQVEFQ